MRFLDCFETAYDKTNVEGSTGCAQCISSDKLCTVLGTRWHGAGVRGVRLDKSTTRPVPVAPGASREAPPINDNVTTKGMFTCRDRFERNLL